MQQRADDAFRRRVLAADAAHIPAAARLGQAIAAPGLDRIHRINIIPSAGMLPQKRRGAEKN
jgi:hypothetical protein